MNQNIFLQALIVAMFSIVASTIAFPFAIRLGKMLGLVDKPNHRKVHHKIIPVVGGLGIGLSMLLIAAFSPILRTLIQQNKALFGSLFIMLLIGIFDDKLSLSVKIRVCIELACGFAIAHSGVRLQNLHGILGIGELPIWFQYAVTIFFILALTNAFNLMDGIDGLLGGISLINAVIFLFAFLIVGATNWLFLFIPLIAALVVFLNYNWHPAKIFMGDAGSLLFGLLFAASSIKLIDKSFAFPAFSNYVIVIISACLMIPAADTLRVFYQRAKQGKSPFSADKTHLHHLFLQLNLSHASATKKILLLHVLIIALSILSVNVFGVVFIIFLQMIIAFSYTAFLKFVHNYFHWFRFIKKYELE